MYTRCSHCHTVCEVSPEALARGRGRLSCTECGQEFDALEKLTSDAPKAAATPVTSAQGALDLTPPVPERTDVLVDVLTAHADFIEPLDADQDADTSQPAISDEAESGTDIPDITGVRPLHDQTTEAEVSVAQDDDEVAEGTTDSLDAPYQSLHAAPPANRHGIPVEEVAEGDRELPGNNAPDTQEEDTLNSASGFLQEAVDDPPSHDAAPGEEPPEAHDVNTSDDPDHTAVEAANLFHPVINPRAPSFIPDTTPALAVAASTERSWPRWLAVAALLLLLIGQSIYAQRDLLAADARWRPSLERACGTLGCTLPAWHDPDTMRLMTRDVRPHPSVPNALLISASFRNDAPWAQHWPRLHLTLSDLNGQTIAQREFSPDQYLGMTARDLTIQPDQTASVTLEVRDPGKQAVAFEFDFR